MPDPRDARRNETILDYHRRRVTELTAVRQPWETVWSGISPYIDPSRYRSKDSKGGPPDVSKIIDSAGYMALRTLKSGMHSGITSPARPWFRLTTYDPELKEFPPVREYLAQVETRMRETFQGSNVYNTFHTGYGDLGQFGQSLSLLAEDKTNTVRMQDLMHGKFWIARDPLGRARAMYRCFFWSVHRIVERFGLERVSQTIRTLYDTSRYSDMRLVWHAIEPRTNRNIDSPFNTDKPFLSDYWEDGVAATANGG